MTTKNMTTAMMMTTKTMNEAIAGQVSEYNDCVYDWLALTFIAYCSYRPSGDPSPLTDEQRAAYRALPGILDRLDELWAALPRSIRPPHCTFVCRYGSPLW
jgi:hypothetical protein